MAIANQPHSNRPFPSSATVFKSIELKKLEIIKLMIMDYYQFQGKQAYMQGSSSSSSLLLVAGTIPTTGTQKPMR